MESIVGLLGIGWLLHKMRDSIESIQRKRFEKALLALEAGVERTYQAYVKAIKNGRHDGRLTDPEKERARSLARARAIALCKDIGIDFLKVIGPDYVDIWIARIIAKRRDAV